ncbi:MAG: AbrB family transcriptional regulator [Candidatus Kapabacteria bacterium]|nr:AbrB family transcriptional regulator [Candidatus Kapabacteria bacterium]
MELSTLTSKNHILLPKSISKDLNFKPAQRFVVINYLDRIELIPLKPISEMKGFLEGINTDFVREDEDRI